MSDKTSKPDVRLLLKVNRERGYGIVTVLAEVVTMTPEGMRNPLWQGQWSAQGSPADAYDSLTVRAQHNTDDESPAWYGWEISYHQPYSVDCDRASAMVKTLKRIEARMAAVAARYGRPDTLGAYLARVADALGATDAQPFGAKVTAERDFSGTGYRWMDADSLGWFLADELKASKPKVAA